MKILVPSKKGIKKPKRTKGGQYGGHVKKGQKETTHYGWKLGDLLKQYAEKQDRCTKKNGTKSSEISKDTKQ